MLQPTKDKTKVLYEAVSKEYDLGTYDEFKAKLADPEKRKVFYDGVGVKYNLGTLEQFEAKVAVKKKESSQPISQNKSTASPVLGGSSAFGNQTLPLKQAKVVSPEADALYDRYKQATTLSPDKVKEIQLEVDDEANNEGFLNQLKTGVSKLTSMAPKWLGGTSGKESVPLYEEKEQAKKELLQEWKANKKANKPAQNIDDKAILERAKQIKIQKRVESEKESLTRDFLSEQENITDDKFVSNREKLKVFETRKMASLQEKDKALLQKQNILRPAIESQAAKIKKLSKEAERLQKAGGIPEDFMVNAKAAQQKYNDLIKEATATHEQYVSNTEQLGNAAENLDVFKRDYSWSTNFLGNLKASAQDLNSGIDGVLMYASPKDSFLYNKASENRQRTNKKTAAIRESIAKPIAVDDINSMEDFGSWMSNTVVAQQVPIYALIASGTGGIAALGASATGTKYGEMTDEEAAGTEQYSDLQKAFIPAGFGLTETASAVVTRYLIKNSARVISSATAPERKLMADGFWTTLKTNAMAVGGQAVKGGAIEATDEAGTQIAQNILDKFAGEKEDMDILANVKDAAAAGAALGFFIPFGANVISQAVKPFTPDSKIQKATAEIQRLESLLGNTELSETARTEIEKQLTTAESRQEEALVKITKGITEMPQEAFDEVLSLERQQASLRKSGLEIQSSPEIDPDSKKLLLNNLKSEFTANNQRRLDILGGKFDTGNTAAATTGDTIETTATETTTAPAESPAATTALEQKEYIVAEAKGKGFTVTDGQEYSLLDENGQVQWFNSAAEAQAEIEKLRTNETAPATTTQNDGNVRPGTEPVGEMATAGRPTGDTTATENTQPATDAGTGEAAPQIKTYRASDNGRDYVVEFKDGSLDMRDTYGNKPKSRQTIKALEEKYAADFDFSKGRRAMDTDKVNYDRLELDVAEQSQNPAEIAELLLSDQVTDFNSGIDPLQAAIAEALNGKVVERGSFTRFGDRNTIAKGLASQYFAKKGQGKGIDQIAMEVEEQIYGDYNATSPRVTTDDIVQFMNDNQGGASKFLNANKKEITDALKTAFTGLTGLPANDKYLQKAVAKQIETYNFTNNYATSLDYMSDAELSAFDTQAQQIEKETYGEKTNTDSGTAGANETQNSEGSREEPGVQSESGRSDSAAPVQPAADARVIDKILDQSEIKGILDFLDELKLPGDTLQSTLPFLPQTWNAFIEAIKLSVKAGNSIRNAIKEAARQLEANGTAKNEVRAIQERFESLYNVRAEQDATALRNADIADKRKELGLPPRETVTRKSNEKLEQDAAAKIETGYDVQELIDDILDIGSTRALTDEEVIILKQYQLGKEDKLIEIGDKIVKSAGTASQTTIDKMIAERDALVDDIDRAFRAGEQSGTVSARALQARRVAVMLDYSLAGMLTNRIKAGDGERLTSDQITETTEQHANIRDLTERLQNKLAELERENNRLKAESVLAKLARSQRQASRKQKVEDIDKNIEDTLKALRDKMREQRGRLSANALPIEMIPDIAKLAVLYAQKGITNLADVADGIYASLKDDIPELTLDDINDIIANYDFEGEAKEAKRLEQMKKRARGRIEELTDKIARGDFAKTERKPVKLDREAQELKDQLMNAKFEWEKALEKDRLEKRDRIEKARDFALDLLNVPRSLMASMDFSAPLRQGLVMTVNHPILASKAFVEMFRQAVSRKRFDRWLYNLKESPQYEVMDKAGLYIADTHNAKLSAREEEFMSNLAEKIPVIGKGFKITVGGKTINIGGLNVIGASEQAYVSYLNKLRADVFSQTADLFEKDGKTIDNSPELYEALAMYVNATTGRGDVGKAQTSAAILNSLFFSPRLILSRIQLLTNWANPMWYRKTPARIRRMYAVDMIRTAAAISTVLALAAASGAEVEDDPRSSDFGKIRWGQTRQDIFGGFQQYIRFLSQVTTGWKKTLDGEMVDLDSKQFGGTTRSDVAINMLRSKFAPVPATIWNLMDGKTLIGENYSYRDVPTSFLPLFARDYYEAIRREGFGDATLKTGLPGIFGVGVQTHKDEEDEKKSGSKVTDVGTSENSN